MNKVWHDRAWNEYVEWQDEDRKTLRRINKLLKDIDRNPFSGIGKPEPLTGKLQGFWSRRIDDANRIIYKVEGVISSLSPNAEVITRIKAIPST